MSDSGYSKIEEECSMCTGPCGQCEIQAETIVDGCAAVASVVMEAERYLAFRLRQSAAWYTSIGRPAIAARLIAAAERAERPKH